MDTATIESPVDRIRPASIIRAAVAAVIAASAVVGCNTVEGAGEDIEKGGEAIQRAAN